MSGEADGKPLTAAVVICTKSEDRWDLLVRAVESVSGQRRKPDEAMLVVDYNERLLKRARQEFTDFTVRANTDHAGLAGARNTGLRTATTDIVAFLDDDAEAHESWLDELLRPYERADVAGVGGWTDPVWRRKPAWFPDEFNWVIGCSFPGMPVGDGVRNFFGVNMSFRRVLALQIGGFSTRLSSELTKQILDDTEFCIRMVDQRSSSVLRLEPRARALHHVSPERETWAYFVHRCISEGRAKAIMASMTSSRPALASERAYTFGVLPRAVARELAASARNRERVRLVRALAIVSGLAYVSGQFILTRAGERLRRREGRRRSSRRLDGFPSREPP